MSDTKTPPRVIRKKTGLIPDAYFSATKVQWMLQNVKGARARAKASGFHAYQSTGLCACCRR